jgi:glyoxylase-like metal-dependent hydrolase (beta-lactamase superfamily II)/ferredoxin
MASPSKRRPENAPGEFFVDETCIDCDTCRWMAPATFDRSGEMSRVFAQPESPAEREAALLALVACPTASIGAADKRGTRRAADAFPVPIEGPVHHAGYHHRDSFGAASYLILRPEGNVLVDSPRFAAPLVRRIDELGGVALLFLTHVDDVADHARWRAHFGCERVLHAADARGELARVERLLEGEAPVDLAPDLRAVPVPGHTRGSTCLVHRGEFLFSGDHLAWSPTRRALHAFRSACWYSWEAQIASMRRLAGERFAWVLPGHGRRWHAEAAQMPAHVEACADWMESVR